MAVLTGKDFEFSGMTDLRCSAFQIATSGPVFDATRPSDSVTRYALGDSTASGRVRCHPSNDSTTGRTIPVKGGSYTITYKTITGLSYTDTITVTKCTYDPRLQPGKEAPQEFEVEFVISTTGGILSA
jgi:hypothetical protein